jgi:2-aminoethylphosphonate-pyruvate transaminase
VSRPTLLLNPGPVTLSARVRQALLREDMCHREPEFAALMLDIKARLLGVYPRSREAFEAIPLTGSGTCAVEAMLSSLAPKGSKTLVVTNGVYGERMAAILARQGKPFQVVASPWTETMDLAAVRVALQGDRAITHVAAVHNETTTGRLNDLGGLADLCEEHGRALMVDCVSSFGGELVDFDRPSLLAVAATGNKCLHGIVGIAFVLVRRAAFDGAPSCSDSLYLDLYGYQVAQRDGFSPFTQAVHACFALQEALRELEDGGGWEARNARYRQLAGRIRTALGGLGVPLMLPEEAYSSMISSFRLPPGWTYERLHDALRAAGFVIYAGQGGLQHAMFRVCNMGDLWDEDIDRLLAVCGGLLGGR